MSLDPVPGSFSTHVRESLTFPILLVPRRTERGPDTVLFQENSGSKRVYSWEVRLQWLLFAVETDVKAGKMFLGERKQKQTP